MDLRAIGVPWALVGGLAVSLRAEPRTTRDIDIAVAVDDDHQAERVVHELRQRGYVLEVHLEQDATDRLATVRLLEPAEGTTRIVVDLLFASSGIEPEIVDAADSIDVAPGLVVSVARPGHLLALKTLANRRKDRADFEELLRVADRDEIELARQALRLIRERGFDRGLDLEEIFDELMDTPSRRDSG